MRSQGKTKNFTRSIRSCPRAIDDQALSDVIREKAKALRSNGVKVKFDISKMNRKEKVGFNGRLDEMLIQFEAGK